MSPRRTERLLNLVIALLATRRWLTKEQIRSCVPQYAESGSAEAFDRMFERDKEELRDLGVPLVTGTSSAYFEDETGYRIDRDAYALPEIAFSPAELAVLGLASRVWQQASLAGPAARALVKLKALGVEPDEQSLVGIEPRVHTREPAFEPLYAATRDHAPVTFPYRAQSTGDTATRRVEPWLITSWHGHWYLVGRDRDREATRVFRVDRVVGAVRRAGTPGEYEIPADVDARELVSGAEPQVPVRSARVALADGVGQSLRLQAGAGGTAAAEVDVPFTDPWRLAEQVAALGAGAVVRSPDDVRAAVRELLAGAAAAHAPAGSAP